MEKSVEWLAGETEVLGENLPQCSFVHHKPHMLPVRRRGGKPASNRWATARPHISVALCISVKPRFPVQSWPKLVAAVEHIGSYNKNVQLIPLL
jgi:hypothetical protein